MSLLPVVLLGPGRVGRAVIDLLLGGGRDAAARVGVDLAVAAVADGSGLLVASAGLGEAALREVQVRKAAGQTLSAWPAGLHGASFAQSIEGPDVEAGAALAPILVDTTAADTTASLLDARARGWRLVLANKVPLTLSTDGFRQITRGGVGARWESTVASSLPVVQTLQTVVDSGDEVVRISAALSGSLGAIGASLERGRAFSAAVSDAVEAGLCEPDPRADLSGLDVARKALILARMLGWDLALGDVHVESLVPEALAASSIPEFLARLPELDGDMADRTAAAAGGALRYLATIESGAVRARLVAVDRSSPFAAVAPGDSIAIIETAAYSRYPLVVSGRAGGPRGAALGVMGDVIALARETGCPSASP